MTVQQIDTYRQSLKKAGLTHVAPQLIDAIEPCVSIQTEPVADDAIPVGGSKFGGRPDVAKDFEWPCWNGEAQSFLAQINLADIARYSCATVLPPSGLLSFFYDPEQTTWGFDPKDRGSWSVQFAPNAELQRAPFPDGLPDHGRHPSCHLAFSDSVTLPSWQSEIVSELALSEKEIDAYIDLTEVEDSTAHHLLGQPQEVQGEMQLECQLASNGIYCGDLALGHENLRVSLLELGATDWQLLLQLDSDDNADWMWGDVGRLYFWITKGDLQSKQFENTWMILQCS